MIYGCAGSSGGSTEQTESPSLSAPSALTVTDTSETSIAFLWQDNSDGEAGFRLERSSNGTDYTIVQTSSSNVTSAVDTGLDAGSRYYYRVSAYNENGNSAYSSIVQVVTLSGSGETTDWAEEDFATVINVGPGLDYESPSEVSWSTLTGSTLVKIHWREAPYRSKWVVTTIATADDPLVITGIANNGQLPVITGEDAVTPIGQTYLNEVRSVIKIGNYESEDGSVIPAWVYLENLEIRSGRPGYYFTDKRGDTQEYAANAAAVHIETGSNITIKDCRLHDCGNGLFTSHLTYDILIAGNAIYDNGFEGDIYEHNTYTESQGIIYEYNRFGPLRDGCNGNNLKDRSAGTIIRYNLIEGGNRQLDLVDTGHSVIFNTPSYDQTFVYGNILIEPADAGNGQIIHYGGDSADTSLYRRGVLYLYHNTIVSKRTSNTTLIRLSTDDVTADIRNNIIYTEASPGHLALTAGQGIVELRNNWLTENFRDTFEATTPDITVSENNITGTDPDFIDADSGDYRPATNSDCIDNATTPAAEAAGFPVNRQYSGLSAQNRITSGAMPDIGAFEGEGNNLSTPCNCDPLPDPENDETTVTVNSFSQMMTEINNATGPKTIYVASGTYSVSAGNFVAIQKSDITLRSLSGNREDVIIEGEGMDASFTSGTYGHGIYVRGDNITIADITVKDVQHHAVFVSAGSDDFLMHNVHCLDSGQQLFKSSGSEKLRGVIQCSTLEYTTTLDNWSGHGQYYGWYTNGIDLVGSTDWIIRDNTIRNIKHNPAVTSNLAGPAILCWIGSSGTTVERNRIINCDFGISFGNSSGNGVQHTGGIIRNNMIKGYNSSDFGIGLVKASGALVVNNTVFSPEGGYGYSIEARFTETTGCTIMNNLTDEPLWHDREGAATTLTTNLTTATSEMFVNSGTGDLHLASDDSDAIDAGSGSVNRAVDIDCESVSDGSPDIGADEYQ